MNVNEKKLGAGYRAWLEAVIVLVGFSVFFLWSIRGTPIYDETEGQYAGAVQEMRRDRSWIPTNNGVPRLQKPPLVYGVIFLSEEILGKNEFAARVPVILSLLVWIASTYLLGREMVDHRLGIVAMLIHGTMLGTVVFGRMIMPEPFLALAIQGAFYGFLKGFRGELMGWTLAWVSMAVGSLAKGFHAALWPMTTVAVMILMRGGAVQEWRGLFRGWGPWYYLVLVIPWYLLVEFRYPGFIRENLWNEQVGHALDFRDPPTYQRVGLGVFLVQHLFLLFPAILFLPGLIVARREWLREWKDPQLVQLLIAWVGVVLVSSCLSARQDYYTMSMWGGFALLLGPIFRVQLPRFWSYFPSVLLILGGVTCVGLLGWFQESVAMRADTSDHFLSVLTGLPLEFRESLKSSIWISAITLCGAGALGVFLTRGGRWGWMPMVIAIGMIGPMTGAADGFRGMGDYFSLKKATTMISPEEVIVFDGPHQLASSLYFYWPRPICFVRANSHAEFVTRTYGTGRDRYWTVEELKRRWSQDCHLILITSRQEIDFWKSQLGDASGMIQTVGGRVIFRRGG